MLKKIGVITFMMTASVAFSAEPSGWYLNHYSGPDKKNWVPEPADVESIGFGMIELTQYPDQQPTPEQQKKADEFVAGSIQNARSRGWFDQKKAFADGFELMFDDRTHYVNKDYLLDGEILNVKRPEFLMYYPAEKGMKLIGIMYGAPSRGPQIGGPLTLWHYHLGRVSCYEQGLYPVADPDAHGICLKGIPMGKSPEMLHVWFFKHPDGPFATRMSLKEHELQMAVREVEKFKE